MPPTPSHTGSSAWSWARIDALPGKFGAKFSRPMNLRVGAYLQQQFKLLDEQRIVIVETQPEQGIGLAERTPADDELGPAF